MNEFLKGNYKLENTEKVEQKADTKNITELFEEKALEKLGGSIAFVMKSNKFLWNGKDEKPD